MKRRVLNFAGKAAIAICILTALATLVAWRRSYAMQERVRWYRDWVISADGARRSALGFGVVNNWGQLRLVFLWRRLPVDSDGTLDGTEEPAGFFYNTSEAVRGYPSNPTWWQKLRFDAMFVRQRGLVEDCDLYLSSPHWAVLAVLLLANVRPIVRSARKFRATRRTRALLCASCGYDLRATPDRCPECGAVPSS